MNKIRISKNILLSLVSDVPATAVSLHQAYITRVEPFAALDQIETALTELVEAGEVEVPDQVVSFNCGDAGNSFGMQAVVYWRG